MRCLSNLYFQCHVASAYGSKRLAFKHEALTGQRVHARWGKQMLNNRVVFATHEEREYPPGFCSAIAQVILQICQENGLTLPPSSMEVAAQEQHQLVQQAKVLSHAFVRTNCLL